MQQPAPVDLSRQKQSSLEGNAKPLRCTDVRRVAEHMAAVLSEP